MHTLLGVQTYFSFHWGTASPAAWMERAAGLGYTRIGFADLAAVHGLPETVRLGKTSPVQPLHGASFLFAGGTSVLAFAASEAGYGSLCECITAWQKACASRPAARAGGVPVLETEDARRECAGWGGPEDVVFLTDDLPAWRAFRAAGAETYWRIGPALTAPPRGVPADAGVFAPGPLLLTPDDFETHRLLRAVGAKTGLDRIPAAEAAADGGGPAVTAQPRDILLPPEEYRSRFAVWADALDRADVLGERLGSWSLNQDIHCPPVPDGKGTFACDGDEALARLRKLAYEGAVIRYGEVTQQVRDRLEIELDLIRRKQFSEYFLVVYDIVSRLAGSDGRVRRGRSVTCGRGSGAASLVNYCLGVTNVDVMKHGLMFERFLNEGRTDPPDIDVDFAWDERDDLLASVFGSFGHERVGRVANHNRYDWRSAFRAAAKTLGFAEAEITRHMRASPSIYAGERSPSHSPEIEDAPVLPVVARAAERMEVLRRGRGSDWNRAIALSHRIIDFPHCLSMHCGGVVISRDRLCRTAPLIVSRKGMPTIQWEKDGAEEMGLVKIDLLGNRSLAVIRDAVRDAAAAEGRSEEEIIPLHPSDDPATQDLVRRGDTFGVFYLESPSMRLLMAKARVGDFHHAVIHSSIIRPAANAFINEYLERLHGKEWEPEHEKTIGLFDESYGIPVYQEDVVRLTMALCGYTYTEADSIRKVLGRRNAKEVIREKFPELRRAAVANGVTEEAVLASFWRTLISMTGYSFCKPHSASYAQVSFESAYLRAHHPAAFIAAVLSNGGGYYTVQAYVSEAMRLGLAVLGPDVNASAASWRSEGPRAVRTGLMAVSGLSGAAMETIPAERSRGGPYRDLGDFFRRTLLRADDARQLALAGALDTLAPECNRPQLLWHAAHSARADAPARRRAGAPSGEGGLFGSSPDGGTGEADPVLDAPPPLPAYSEYQRRAAEYSVLGFIPGCHPLVLFEKEIRRSAEPLRRRQRPLLTRMRRLPHHTGRLVTVLAWPITAKIVETKHGDAMMFQTFEDGDTLCEAVIFPEEFRRYHSLLGTVQPLWLTGRVIEEFGVTSLQILGVRAVCALAAASGNAAVLYGQDAV